MFETGERRGVVSFITASSYLRGPGFAGMRRHMRETFEELWILDLGGEGRGARRSENVFAIQTPVAIAIGYRTDETRRDEPARVRYSRIDGTREEKLRTLAAITSLDDVEWRDCLGGWAQPFLPEGEGDFFAWPALTGIFPWQQPGVKAGRTWPISADPATLDERWRRLLGAPADQRERLFKNSPTGRKVNQSARTFEAGGGSLESLASATGPGAPPVVRYGYRSLDRQFLIGDPRVIDRPGPSLWATQSSRQLYLTSLLTGLLGDGPAATVTHLIPDLHHFRGSFGGRDTIPLWRDAACTKPNVTHGLLDTIAERLGRAVPPEDMLAYCYALLAAPSYTTRFREELEDPGPARAGHGRRRSLRAALALGRELIWLHTFGERFVPPGQRAAASRRGRRATRRRFPSGRTPIRSATPTARSGASSTSARGSSRRSRPRCARSPSPDGT